MTQDIGAILSSIDKKMATQVKLLSDMKKSQTESNRDADRKSKYIRPTSTLSNIGNMLSGTGEGVGKASSGVGSGIGDVLGGLGKSLAGGGLGLAAVMVAAGLMDAQKIKDNVVTLLSIPSAVGGGLEMLLDGGLVGAALWGLGKALQPFAISGAIIAATEYFSEGNWAESVKENVLTLLSIADGISGNVSMLLEGAILGSALAGLGIGLAAFGVGQALIGLGQWTTDTTWAEQVKSNVHTLLSIADGITGNVGMLLEGQTFGLAMLGLGAGLAALAVGQGAMGLAQFVTDDDWAQRVKDSVATLLSIGDLPGIGWNTATFVASMIGLSSGLAAFALGTGANVVVDGAERAIGYFTGEPDFAQRIKDQVATLLSIAELPGIGGDTVGFVATMLGLSSGLAAFALGKGANTVVDGADKAIAYFADQPDFAQRIKDQVATLLSIPGMSAEGSVDDFLSTMSKISLGLIAFAGGELIGTLTEAGVALLGFFGVDSPMDKVLALAKEADQLEKGAAALEKIANALEVFGNIKIARGGIDFAGLAEDLGKAVPLLDALANGGEVAGSDGWLSSPLVFPKGILDPSLRLDEMAEAISKVNYVLGQSAVYPSPSTDVANAKASVIESSAAKAGSVSTINAPTVNNVGGSTTNNSSTTIINTAPHTSLNAFMPI